MTSDYIKDGIEVLSIWLRDLGYKRTPGFQVVEPLHFARSITGIHLCTMDSRVVLLYSDTDAICAREITAPHDPVHVVDLTDPDCFRTLLNKFRI
jgi:hypothetical protein